MKRILIYPAGPAQEEAFLEAQSLGLKIITMDRDPSAYCFKYADEYFVKDPSDLSGVAEMLNKYLEEKKIDGALLVGADIPETQAMICSIIGKKGISSDAAKLTVDKFKMKQVLKEAGIKVPDFYKITSPAEIEKFVKSSGSTMILKPNDNCGARGVIRLSPDSDFEASFRHTSGFIKKEGIILEKYEPGLQISIEGLVIDGEVFTTGFADRNYNMLEKLFPYVIENGATMPSVLNATEMNKVISVFEKAVSALGINTGVAKGDMIFNGNEAIVIEIAGRISGGKFASKLVPLSTGVNLLKAAILQAVDSPVDMNLLKNIYRKGVAVRYFFPKSGRLIRIEGLEEVQEENRFIELKIIYKPGEVIPEITSHAQRGGWVVCTSENRDDAVKAAESISKRIKFITE